MRITDDVTVPAGHTLNIEPGTLILIEGTPGAQSSAGKDLVVEGTVNASGTELEPITFTAVDPSAPWGQILFSNAEGASFTWTNVHRAGHSPAGGHTGHGRVLHILGSDVTFTDCNITDNRGKCITPRGLRRFDRGLIIFASSAEGMQGTCGSIAGHPQEIRG